MSSAFLSFCFTQLVRTREFPKMVVLQDNVKIERLQMYVSHDCAKIQQARSVIANIILY